MSIDPKAEKQFDKLKRATFDNNEAEVAKLIAKVDPDLQPCSLLGDSLLCVAIRNGATLSMVKLLVEHGAKHDYASRSGATPISAAQEHDRVDVIEYFASRGVDVVYVAFPDLPQADKDARLAKILGDWHRDDCATRVAEALAGGADPKAKVDGMTATRRIAGHGDLVPLFTALLAAGADPRDASDDGETVAHLLARHGYAKALALFLDAGVPLDFRDGKGNTLLHRAAGDGWNGADKTVKLLLERGADVGMKNTAGNTVLDVAGRDCREQIIKHSSKPLSDSARALLEAVSSNDGAAVAKALTAGADPSELDTTTGKSWGSSGQRNVAAIHVALARGVDLAIAQQVVTNASDINVRTADGRTPLDVLLQYGQGEGRAQLLAQLLERSADLDARNARGEPPWFQLASFYKLDGELELVDAIAAKADLQAKDKAGATVLDQMFERTQRFSGLNGKRGFVALLQKLVALGIETSNRKQLDAWLAGPGAKFLPKPKPARKSPTPK